MMSITARVLSAAVLILAVGLWQGTARAQQQQPSANAIALARQVIELKGAAAVYQNAVPGVIEHVRDQIMRNNISYQKDLVEITAKLEQDNKGREKEMGDEMARLYATDFTEAELKDIVAFYKSPLGQKLLTQEPKTIAASLQYMQSWGERFGDEMDAKFHEEMKKRGKALQ
jgi:hypothetical protein